MDKPLARQAHAVTLDRVGIENSAEGPSELPPVVEKNPVNAEGLLHSAQSLLQELKNAYVKVLHEKEEQITQLKEEVIDLKTLVKILESENERLKSNRRESAPIDEWLDQNL